MKFSYERMEYRLCIASRLLVLQKSPVHMSSVHLTILLYQKAINNNNQMWNMLLQTHNFPHNIFSGYVQN